MKYQVLWWCGLLEFMIGLFLMGLMMASFYDGNAVLKVLFQIPENQLGLISGNSWAQTAIAFGMHSYADIANGLEQMSLASKRTKLAMPTIVSVWNTTKFAISFLWCLLFIKGMATIHGLDIFAWPIMGLFLIAVLVFEVLVVRSCAVYCQRSVTDAHPPIANSEVDEWNGFTVIQKACRCVFYYEGILSGCSGATYCIFPELFVWLYGLEKFSDHVVLWSFAQFGVNVMAFGLYQMSAEIDTRAGHVIWWLILDIVWMYLFWDGIRLALGDWNPLTFSGANIWCHIGFHADSSLAVARAVFLTTLLINGRPKVNKLE